MSDTNNRPLKDGSLRGDDKAMPDQGTGTGVTDTYGASVAPNATNSKGKMTGTGSDGMDECYSDDPLRPDSDD